MNTREWAEKNVPDGWRWDADHLFCQNALALQDPYGEFWALEFGEGNKDEPPDWESAQKTLSSFSECQKRCYQ